jgi:8-oxo-dGTP pyrophosphatase MutT (NUDIX family)
VNDYRVVHTTERFANRVFRLVSDEVAMPGDGTAKRDYLQHIGAVGVVVVDQPDGGEERVLLIRQYRHPVRQTMWELPAGLTDVPGEPPLDTARRELAEEADLTARTWYRLVELHTTPGCSDELIRLYLARDVAEVPAADRHHRTDEEAELTTECVPLSKAVGMVLAGEVTNAACVAGVLAAARARDTGWADLRPA